jgi:DNA-directed RNA polymerase specialized sigma24 family protein
MDTEPAVERERATRLFLKHQQMLQEYIHGLVRHAHDAEDLFQEVGVEIMHKATVPADPEAFGAWSRGVARNMVLHYWRTQRRRQAASVHMLNLVDQAYEEAEP